MNIEEKIEKYLGEAKPYGKIQETLYDAVQKLDKGTWELNDIMQKFSKEFHNVHFNKVLKAAKALDKKGLIEFDGISKVTVK